MRTTSAAESDHPASSSGLTSGPLEEKARAETTAMTIPVVRADEAVRSAANVDGLRFTLSREDLFPATENDDNLQDALDAACKANCLPYKYLDVPFRWSEDFGHYGQHIPACFFGVGAGLDTPPLHTESYTYPDKLAPITAELFLTFLLFQSFQQF